MNRSYLPLAGFILLACLLYIALDLEPEKLPSPLIEKQAPAFSLAILEQPADKLSARDMLGQVWVLNVWASWCVSCRAEHEVITDLASRNLVAVIGLNYKDQPADAERWLGRYGNPYTASVIDLDGRVGIDWGVYGVPETFIIGADGAIKLKHVGPVTHESLKEQILPKLAELLG